MSSNLDNQPVATPHTRQKLMERLSFLGQMGSTETALFQQRAAELMGVNVTDNKAVSALMQEGPMTAGELATRLSLTTGAVTNLIDRLEKAGYIKRMPDAHDRRKVILILVPEKLKESSKIYDSVGKAFNELLSGYTIEQLEFLIEYHEAVIRNTKVEIAKLAQQEAKKGRE